MSMAPDTTRITLGAALPSTSARFVEWLRGEIIDEYEALNERARKVLIEFASEFTVFEVREDGQLVGLAGLRQNRHQDLQVAQAAGFVFKSTDRGRGLGTEALRQLVRYGFEELGLRQIWAEIDDTNTASLRCVAKAGFARGERIVGQTPPETVFVLIQRPGSPRSQPTHDAVGDGARQPCLEPPFRLARTPSRPRP